MKFDLYIQRVGVGEPIVFLHGDTLDHRQWDPQINYFTPKFQTISYDMRGFGHSPNPIEPFDHYQDLHRLFNHLNLPTAHLVGSSYGGEVALDFTCTFPNRVKTLTLINTALSGFPCDVDWDVGADSLPLDQVKQNWLGHPVFTSLQNYPDALKKVARILDDYQGSKWLEPTYHRKPARSAMSQLQNIRIPVHNIVGELDLPYFHQIADHLVNRISGATKTVVANCGHLLNLEAPDICNNYIEQFITSNTPVLSDGKL